MSILAEFSTAPIGVGASISPQVARVLKIVIDSGIRYKVNPMGTVIEGEWEEIMALIRKCHAEVMKDSERVITMITIDDRKGRDYRIEKKLESVEQKIGRKLNR